MESVKLKTFVSAKYMFKVKYGPIHSINIHYNSHEAQLCMLRSLTIMKNTRIYTIQNLLQGKTIIHRKVS